MIELAPPVVHRRAASGRLAPMITALVGLVVSLYLTIEHYSSSVTLACPDNGAINCVRVTTSRWSTVGPLPVALLGAIFFAVMTIACLPAALRIRRLDVVRIAGAAVGVAIALGLVWVELFELDAICLWCTIVHVDTVVLLGAVLWQATSRDRVSSY